MSELKVIGVLETSIYTEDLPRAVRFYESLFGFPKLICDSRMCAFAVAPGQVLLLFKRGATLNPVHTPGGLIPAHDGSGPLHFAFSITHESLASWRENLVAHRIALTGDVKWERGGTSLYFNDPDGNVVELATPGIWANF